MNNKEMKLTDLESIEELKSIIIGLRNFLEILLEDSNDESQEKTDIRSSLEELSNIFIVLNWKKAIEYTDQALNYVPKLSAFGEDDAEKFLLRYCLILEQSIDSYNDLGCISESDLIGDYEAELDINSEDINVTLLKILRTLYQKQLLMLIKNTDKTVPLKALKALSRDISSVLPRLSARDWLLLAFYIQALLKNERVCDVNTHRLLAHLDVQLAELLLKKDSSDIVYEDLVKVISTLENGPTFIENNILAQDIYSITPAVYKRFGLALKDELVKIHEQLERIYLDQTQLLRLQEFLPFLANLKNILNLMGLKRLSLLTEKIYISFKHLDETLLDDTEFNKIVSQFWILESFLSNLWLRRDQIVPLSYNEAQNWAYLSAKQSTLKLFTSEYRKIREQIIDIQDERELKDVQQKLFNTIQAEKILSISYGLTRYFIDDFMLKNLSKEDLLEVALAIEYISNMNFENREVVDDVVYSAQEILQRHVQELSQSILEVDRSKFDADLIEAFTEDLSNLEYDLNAHINKGNTDQSVYDDLIRIVHTLRGNANIVQLTDVAKLAAVIESNMRSNTSYNDEIMQLYYKSLLNIIEQFKAFLDKVK